MKHRQFLAIGVAALAVAEVCKHIIAILPNEIIVEVHGRPDDLSGVIREKVARELQTSFPGANFELIITTTTL